MLKNVSQIHSFLKPKFYVKLKSHFSTIKDILGHKKPGDKVVVKASIHSPPLPIRLNNLQLY